MHGHLASTNDVAAKIASALEARKPAVREGVLRVVIYRNFAKLNASKKSPVVPQKVGR